MVVNPALRMLLENKIPSNPIQENSSEAESSSVDGSAASSDYPLEGPANPIANRLDEYLKVQMMDLDIVEESKLDESCTNSEEEQKV